MLNVLFRLGTMLSVFAVLFGMVHAVAWSYSHFGGQVNSDLMLCVNVVCACFAFIMGATYESSTWRNK